MTIFPAFRSHVTLVVFENINEFLLKVKPTGWARRRFLSDLQPHLAHHLALPLIRQNLFKSRLNKYKRLRR
jgi:hypothetical protein